MVKFYFDNDTPFKVSPQYSEPKQHPKHKVIYFRTTNAFKSVKELLNHPLKSQNLNNIYEIDIDEPHYYIKSDNFGAHQITNLGKIPYREINYTQHLPHNHPLLIAKGINQDNIEISTSFVITTSNEARIYALIQRGKPEDLEKIIDAWHDRHSDIYDDFFIIKEIIKYHAEKYGNLFLQKATSEWALVQCFAKYGTSEQHEYLIKQGTNFDKQTLAKYGTFELKQKLLKEKSVLIKQQALVNVKENELDLSPLLKTEHPKILEAITIIANQEELYQLLHHVINLPNISKLTEITVQKLTERCIETYPDLLEKLVEKLNENGFNPKLLSVDNNVLRNKLIKQYKLTKQEIYKLITEGGYPYLKLFENDSDEDIQNYVREQLAKQSDDIQTIKDAEFAIPISSINRLSNQQLLSLLEEDIAPFKKETIQKALDNRSKAGQF